MKRLIPFFVLLFAACTSPSYPGIDRPQYGGNSSKDLAIIDYIDQRLETEYYWLDEVAKKCNTFDRQQPWEGYLSSVLSRLQTNLDDGYINSKGQRVFYSYIHETQSTTRAEAMGFGIELHYTVVLTDRELGHYCFVVENIFDGSPASLAGIKRGDLITMINDSFITSSNYAQRFNSIQGNTAESLKLALRRQVDGSTITVELQKGAYSATPVAHHEVIEVEGFNRKIGYLVYTGFESEYDEELLAAIAELKASGAEELILDLRCNSGGSLLSAQKLTSALVPATFEDQIFCSIERNSLNTKMEPRSEFRLAQTGELLSLQRLTVICSDYTASSSELVIMGLRGLDFPVTLIGSITEGKNCGMDVTRRTIAGISLEFAPITFMCFNAKGVGDWGDGILPDVDLTVEGNQLGISDENYPLPRTDWGDAYYDIALAAALASITGKSVATAPHARRQSLDAEATLPLARPVQGIRNYVE